MSAMLEALRARYELELTCPKCHAQNVPNFRCVQIVSLSRADCDSCGFSGDLPLFLPAVSV